NRDSSTYVTYRITRKQLNSDIKRAKSTYQFNLLSNISEPKILWKELERIGLVKSRFISPLCFFSPNELNYYYNSVTNSLPSYTLAECLLALSNVPDHQSHQFSLSEVTQVADHSRLPLSIVSQKSGFISSGHEMPADRARNGNGVHEEEPNRRRRWYTKQLQMIQYPHLFRPYQRGFDLQEGPSTSSENYSNEHRRLIQSISHHFNEELNNDHSYIITMESGEDVAYFYTEPVEEENPPSTPENSVEQDQLEEEMGVSSTTEDSDECNFLNLLAAIADDLSKPYEYQEEDSDEMLPDYEDEIPLSNDELVTSTVQETYSLTVNEEYLSDEESITSTVKETFSLTYELIGFTNQNNFSAVFID
ncbi:hypothetical protein M0802_013534, partial [Mischocyttarus mexicanus]